VHEVSALERQNLTETIDEIIDECIRSVEELSRHYSIVALILTGSFARDEGSILLDDSGVAHVLGDIEFFLVLNHRVYPNIAFNTMLNNAAAAVEERLKHKQIICKIEFSPVVRQYFRRIKPNIFNYELQRHGKVVLGMPAILAEIPPFSPESIPAVDGFYLLCNRIVEQLIVVKSLSQPFSDIRYQILKLYLDMAGSCLVVSGRYAPTYAERVGLCAEVMASENIIIAADRRQSFLEILKAATEYKLNPNTTECPLMSGPYSPKMFWKQFKEAAAFCKEIWLWEIQYLFGASDKNDSWTVSANHRFPVRFVVREWLKFLLMAHRAGQEYSVWRAIRMIAKGTPRTMIYAAAANLYFSLAEGQKVDLGAIEQLLPIPCRLDSEEQALDAVIAAWNNFVRSA